MSLLGDHSSLPVAGSHLGGRRARDEDAGRQPGHDRLRLRVLCASLLAAAAVVSGEAVISILGAHPSSSAVSSSGVFMPDDHRFRETAGALAARRPHERLRSIVIGASGAVTVRRAAPGAPAFLPRYLNPGVVPVLARAAGASSDVPIVVRELRLGTDAGGRQRWQLTGTRGGRPWVATINPNGTDLQRVKHPRAAS